MGVYHWCTSWSISISNKNGGTTGFEASQGVSLLESSSNGGGFGRGGSIGGRVVDGSGGVGGGSAQSLTSMRGRGRVRDQGVWPGVIGKRR